MILIAGLCAAEDYRSDYTRRTHQLRWPHRPRRQSAVAFDNTGIPEEGAFGDAAQEEVAFGELDAALDSGPWDFWKSATPCSRSCGGGVSLYKRACRQQRVDGSSMCSGPVKRYQSCNLQPCPAGSRDFREEQCSNFDGIPFERRYYKWIPYRKAAKQCELNCKPVGERFYFRHRRNVVDGTSCGEDDLDICVDGDCTSVGCEGRLGSLLREDQCRVCGGDGSSCRTASGTFDSDRLQQGYNDILLIPEGATHIEIKEVKASSNYLALRNLTGHFYLNGNWRIDTPNTRTLAGSRFHYERQRGGFFGPERIRALGPTTEALYLVLLYQERNPGIQYRYSVPTSVAETGTGRYYWVPHQWSQCSAACGEGTRQRDVSCVQEGAEVEDDTEVSDDLCDALEKPEVTEPCKEQNCSAIWIVGNWSSCSVECGSGGVEVRPVTCGRALGDGVTAVVEDAECLQEAARPADTRSCDAPACPSYYVGEWSPCDRLCGEGQRRRQVRCHRIIPDRTELLPDSACAAERPNATEPCWRRPCQGIDWIAASWSGCSHTCGLVIETRRVVCASEEGNIFDDSFCHERRKPESSRTCQSASQCEYSWYASQWSECSSACGEGVRTRRVFCGFLQSETGAITPVQDNLCDPNRRYSASEPCTGSQQPPCPARWHISPWGPCSASCEGGSQTREVFCSDGAARVPLDQCDGDQIPFTLQQCNDISCADAELLKQLEVATQTYVPLGADDDCLEDFDYDEDPASGSGSGEDEDSARTDLLSFTDLVNRALDSITEEQSSGEDGSGKGGRDGSGTVPYLVEVPEDIELAEGSGNGKSVDNSNVISPSPLEGLTTSPEVVDSATETAVSDIYQDSSLKDVFADLFSDSVANASDADYSDIFGDDYSNYSDTLRRRRRQTPDNDTNTISEATPESGSTVPSEGPLFGDYTGDDSSLTIQAAIGDQFSFYEDEGLDSGGLFGDGFGDASFEDIFPDAASPLPRSDPRRKCRRRPALLLCGPSAFGCCPDGLTAAAGPFLKDCPELTTCKKTRFGCCPDRVTPATNQEGAECPPASDCGKALFGCCSDNFTARGDAEGSGCPPEAPQCQTSRYGCCKDGESPAQGAFGEGCPGVKPTPPPTTNTPDAPVNCSDTKHGCCSDGVSASSGADQQGCPPACVTSQFGCCLDSELPAHGPDQEGCCVTALFGCCPDNVTPAQGDDLEGCGCAYSAFGCCPDNHTLARGAELEGCGCQYTAHGCCPDGYTPAAGQAMLGCGCHTYTYGCCEDGRTPAQGLSQEGCGCDETEFGCCEDGRSRASGPHLAGCGCQTSHYGCCPDGNTSAQGDDFQGCPQKPTDLGELCVLPKERGPCRNFTVRWFFDTEYGGCARFWYGGCHGNDNSFDSDEQCEATCVKPEGTQLCQLPLIGGPCEGDYPAWHYNSATGQCRRFRYGGCLGNGNRFNSQEECQKRCVVQEILDPCRQEVRPGPCGGKFKRWFYDVRSESCTRFIYGGCKGNLNNFLTEQECQHRCSSRHRQAVCSLPRAEGTCNQSVPRWYFDFGQSRCMPFYYSGCGANLNNFRTQAGCQASCPEQRYAAEACSEPLAVGNCSSFSTQYWYSPEAGDCQQFQYSGCGGNRNRFRTGAECQRACQQKSEQDLNFQTDWCSLGVDAGDCRDREVQWYYDSARGRCAQFAFSGCGGNRNRFATEQLCQRRCAGSQDVCSLPRMVGPCSGSLRQFYFDTRLSRCLEFDYSGCQGNGNRFNTRAECQFRCAPTPSTPEHGLIEWTTTTPQPVPDDICQLRHDPGPCREPTRAWFFRASEGVCRQFTYGGCRGNQNKFVSVEQCQRKCGEFKAQDACATSPSAGGCSSHMVRWFYDRSSGRCRAFTYTGCGGSANRFGTEEECRAVCVDGRELRVPDSMAPNDTEATTAAPTTTVTPLIESPSVDTPVTTPSSTEAPRTGAPPGDAGVTGAPETAASSTEVEPEDSDCTRSKQHCRQLVCPMGIERTIDAQLCEKCSCYQPCQHVECGPRERCVIGHRRDEDDGLVITAACRLVTKPGVCASPNDTATSTCRNDTQHQCSDDAVCVNNRKCCSDGCSLRCLVPEGEEELEEGGGPTTAPADQTTAPVTPSAATAVSATGTESTRPAQTTPDPRARIMDFSSAVEAAEGSLVELKCRAQGDPQPIIHWKRATQKVDITQGRYRQLRSGTLQIVGALPEDAGEYTCVADNYRATPDRRRLTLTVLAPTAAPARVLPSDLEEQPVAELGGPALLRCYAYGWPRPSVTWWRGRAMLPLSSKQYHQVAGHGLLIRVVRLPDLGVYTCQAYNGRGRAVAWSTQLRAYGPVDSPPPQLWSYLRFVVTRVLDASKAVGLTTTTTEIPEEEEFPARRPAETEYRPEYAEPDPPTGTVPVSTSITLSENTFPVGAEIRIPCLTSGRPAPTITWYKDGAVISADSRRQLTADSLVVASARPYDAGQYRCRAANRYSASQSSVSVGVEGVYIPPSCVDNPFFANCRLIVAARYCTNQYYARFCCRSCTEDGQLPLDGPHLSNGAQFTPAAGIESAGRGGRVLAPGPQVVGSRRRIPRRRRLRRLRVRFRPPKSQRRFQARGSAGQLLP